MKCIHVTPEAAAAFGKKLLARGTPNSCIRLGVRGGGCSGFSYVLAIDDSGPTEHDESIVVDSVVFLVDPKSAKFLSGTILNWEKTLMHEGFKIENPNERSRCGCGKSFST